MSNCPLCDEILDTQRDAASAGYPIASVQMSPETLEALLKEVGGERFLGGEKLSEEPPMIFGIRIEVTDEQSR
jgi:hypothetical protein